MSFSLATHSFSSLLVQANQPHNEDIYRAVYFHVPGIELVSALNILYSGHFKRHRWPPAFQQAYLLIRKTPSRLVVFKLCKSYRALSIKEILLRCLTQKKQIKRKMLCLQNRRSLASCNVPQLLRTQFDNLHDYSSGTKDKNIVILHFTQCIKCTLSYPLCFPVCPI